MNSPLQDFKNVFRDGGNGLTRLIVANVIVFVVIAILGVAGVFGFAGLDDVVLHYLVLPAWFSSFITRPWTIITYFFTHEGLYHILFNMLFLYWFGQILQEYLGTRRLLTAYFLGGIMGGLLYMVAYTFVPAFQPYLFSATLLGASGAVYAVVTAAATLTPNYTFLLLFLGPVRIVYIAIFYIFVSFIEIKGSNPGGNIAHLGGALMGFLFIRILQSGTDLGGWFWSIVDGLKTSRGGRMTVTHRGGSTSKIDSSKPKAPANPAQDEIDAILDKINKVGYEKLSREEKEKLFAAGQGGQK